jgi:3'(2'), 5'-bisphosphate nucleotidase
MRHGLSDIEVANRLPDIAKAAGDAILDVYNSPQAMQGRGVQHKADASPLTEADLSAHRVIVQQLAALGSQIPIVSEEDEASHARRVPVGAFWIIDPLDGTKEFIARNGQFTVNIALVRDGAPVLGVVYAPVLDEMFWNVPEQGAWVRRAGATHRVHVATKTARADQPVRVLASRSHMTPETEAFIRSLGAHEVVQAGSSLKFCRIAEGAADCYPRLGPTCEWDTAAAQAVLEAAGGHVQSLDGVRLGYGKSDVLNPSFVASAWPLRLKGDAA